MTTLIRPDNRQPAHVLEVTPARIALDCTCITKALRWFSIAELATVNDRSAIAQACKTPVLELTPEAAAHVNGSAHVQIVVKPPTRHVISIGGGISSTWLLVDRVLTKYSKDNCEAVICALANEHPDLWRLVAAVEKKYDITIKRIGLNNKTYNIWDIFFHTGMMGSTLADPCSRMLKREVMAAYMEANYTPADTVMHVGITADEIDRMLAIRANWGRKGWKVEADLANEPKLNRETLIAMCQQEFGFVPETYRRGHSHNNCGGFCVKAGKSQMARLLYYDRPAYLEHERMELLHQQTFSHTNTIMRDEWTRTGIRGADPLTLRAFRERMETKWRGMLPGFNPFDGLDDTPGCKFCEAA